MNSNTANGLRSRLTSEGETRQIARALVVALCFFAACSDSPAPSAGEDSRESVRADAGFPRTITDPTGYEVLIPNTPRRVIPANANALDFVLALVEPSRVAAISEVSLPYSLAGKALASWPQEKTFGPFTVEEILTRNPDLVVTHDWQAAQTVALLREAGVPVLVIPSVAKLEDNFTSLELLGRALGEEDRAAQLTGELRARIAKLQERGRALDASVLSYTNMGTGGTCAGSKTSFAVMTEIAGLTNLATASGLVGFETVDNEWLLSVNPDWIVVGESVEQPGTSSAEQYLLQTRGLSGLKAVQRQQIIRLQSDFFFTSSHYLVDAAERLLDELDALNRRE